MTTVRLSNYQKKVLDEAKKRIDRARNCKSIYEYLTEVLHFNDRIINILKNENQETLQMYTDACYCKCKFKHQNYSKVRATWLHKSCRNL